MCVVVVVVVHSVHAEVRGQLPAEGFPFYLCVRWGLTSDRQVCMAGTLLTEPPWQPQDFCFVLARLELEPPILGM